MPAARWGELVTGEKLFPWQRKELAVLTADDRPRVAYFQMPRKNGKTRFAAVLALHEACNRDRRHIYAISDSERNLHSTMFREMRDIIGGSEYLRDSVHIFKNHIEVPETGSFIETRPSNFKASQGINPHLVLFDEVHLQKGDEIWAGMQMAGAARDDALLFGITTPGYDVTGLAHGLYEAVKAGDPTIYGRIFEADPAADIDDREAWKQANPCYGRIRRVLEVNRRSPMAEHNFRRFHLGQWTATEKAWLPYGAWAACEDSSRPAPPPGTKVWLGFDGSISRDATALVGVTEDLHVFVVGCWENPGRAGWRVPRAAVNETVADAFDTWDVVELACDPPKWPTEIAEWNAVYGDRVFEFPTGSRARMAPACTAFSTAVMEQSLTHDGDPRLARHVSNAIVKSTPMGDYITKPDKDSPSKIDLAVAAVVALHRAATSKRRGRPALALV